jgi:hypothetical protein
MTTTASISLDASDVTTDPIYSDQCHDERWSIRIANVFTPGSCGLDVWISGTVDELDEALLRLGESVLEVRRRIRGKQQLRLVNAAVVGRALGVTP